MCKKWKNEREKAIVVGLVRAWRRLLSGFWIVKGVPRLEFPFRFLLFLPVRNM